MDYTKFTRRIIVSAEKAKTGKNQKKYIGHKEIITDGETIKFI